MARFTQWATALAQAIANPSDAYYLAKDLTWRAVSADLSVRKNGGSNVGPRPRLNLLEGAGISLTVTDDSVDNEIDVTIAAAQQTVATCPSSGSTWTPDGTITKPQLISPTGTFTIDTPSGTPATGNRIELWVKQDATGDRVPTWNAWATWPVRQPGLLYAPNKITKFIFEYDGSNWVCIDWKAGRFTNVWEPRSLPRSADLSTIGSGSFGYDSAGGLFCAVAGSSGNNFTGHYETISGSTTRRFRIAAETMQQSFLTPCFIWSDGTKYETVGFVYQGNTHMQLQLTQWSNSTTQFTSSQPGVYQAEAFGRWPNPTAWRAVVTSGSPYTLALQISLDNGLNHSWHTIYSRNANAYMSGTITRMGVGVKYNDNGTSWPWRHILEEWAA